MAKWDRLVRADVFFTPSARLLPLTDKTPYVVTAHDLSYERWPEFYSWRRRIWHKFMRPRKLMQRSAQVIAVSEATARDVMDLYKINRNQVKVVYSGVTEIIVNRAVNLSLPERFVLYLGTMEPRKNIVSIIEAYSAIAEAVDHDLVIAGSAGWLMRKVNQALDKSPVLNRIHHIGFVSETDKWQLYRQADLFVYPSFYEGFGFPPLEALVAGTAVITSFNSSLPEVVGDWATLIDPYDVAELALVMKELLGDPPEVTEEVKQAIRYKFSWERTARETLEVIESVV